MDGPADTGAPHSLPFVVTLIILATTSLEEADSAAQWIALGLQPGSDIHELL
jgi:hypothetical protein